MTKSKTSRIGLVVLMCILAAGLGRAGEAQPVQGWLHWRGPQQNGTSLETNLPSKWERGATNDLWSVELAGRGTPVIAGNRVYAWGYRGEKDQLREVLACLDAGTGNTIWEKQFNDFLSDVVYDRYSIGSPTIDPETGNVFLVTTAGDFYCFTPDGKQVWFQSLTEAFGRKTFPNGRTGAVSIDADLAVVHMISANWGAEGPARDRFYAFDKKSGELVWSSDPGVGPPYLKDSSFASPVFAFHGGKRVFYCVLGDGNVVCVNARTGVPLWRFQLAIGGLNSSPLLYKETLIAVNGVENIDSSKAGRMVALNINATGEKDENGKIKLPASAELWRNEDVVMFTSSPTLVGGRVYQLDQTGVLFCLDVATGKKLWTKKLGTDQIHASPLYADGKLYVPMNEGLFYILKPTDTGAEELSKVQLEGNCLGSPAVWDGRVYVFTTERLYCFGHVGGNASGLPKPVAAEKWPAVGPAAAIQTLPAEALLQQGRSQTFRMRAIDANGFAIGPVKGAKWEKFIPPTAKVKATLDADFNEAGQLVAGQNAKASAGAFKATAEGISGTIRGRVQPALPHTENFEDRQLTEDHATEAVKFAYPSLPWIGGRMQWEVRDVNTTKALAKTTDNPILNRAVSFIGDPLASNYTMQADVMSDGNKRGMGEVGVINQRYLIALKGNADQIEINSNVERLKATAPFKMTINTWYTLKTRVDMKEDGSAVVRAKAWPAGEKEPDAWTLQVTHEHAHTHGSPGLYGLSPQPKFRVFIDNIAITPN